MAQRSNEIDGATRWGSLGVLVGVALLILGLSGRADSRPMDVQLVDLHNDRAEVSSECDGVTDAWHFVIAPNNNEFRFLSMTLVVADTVYAVPSNDMHRIAGQSDNVLVEVPEGRSATDLEAVGSFAEITPGSSVRPVKFVLSHVCTAGHSTSSTTTTSSTSVPGDSTTTTTTSSTSVPGDSTTTTSTTSSTSVPGDSTTTTSTTSSTSVPGDSTTTTSTTIVDQRGATTTTVASSTTSTTVPDTSSTTTTVSSTSTTTPTSTTTTTVPKPTAVTGSGSTRVLMLLGGVLVIVGGAAVLGSRLRSFGDR